jgi:hypothetical protein
VRRLPERERRVLELRFGFDGEPTSLEQIGRELKISRERVRQVERDALAALEASWPTSSRFRRRSSPRCLTAVLAELNRRVQVHARFRICWRSERAAVGCSGRIDTQRALTLKW